jgi:predicted nucleotidyltransferase
VSSTPTPAGSRATGATLVLGNVILQGVVGSTAYGLAREGSDVDRLGIYVAPTREFLGLNPPTHRRATKVWHEPDLTLHEVGKFCSLALQCNPTILELLWLVGDEFHWEAYEVATTYGIRLVHMRRDFLSRQRVRDAYFNYATQQFDRLKNRSRFPDVPVNRIAKHARHLRRLLNQGLQLYETATMTVQVSNPEAYFTFGERVAAGDLGLAESLILDFEEMFNEAKSPLPETPSESSVDNFLVTTRKAFL